jgi:hypothetical protein
MAPPRDGTTPGVTRPDPLSAPVRDSAQRRVRLAEKRGGSLRDLAWLLAAHLACVPVWLPWVSPAMDLLQLEDALAHLIRLYHLAYLLERDVWYPRWVPDMFLGYGYPLFNFYAPGFYYLSWLPGRLLGLDVWESFRAGGLLAALAGLTGAFALARRLWRRPDVAAFATVCFGYLPYVFHVLLYKRGDLPEFAALMATPWLLLAVHAAWHARGARLPARCLAWPVAGLAAAGAAVILAHNLTALTAALLAAGMAAMLLMSSPSTRRRVAMRCVVLGGVLAACATAWFWLPALAEIRGVHVESITDAGLFDWHSWLTDPAGHRERDFSPENRQTPTGWIDTNLRYPNQIVATPKLSLSQVALLAITAAVLLALSLRALPPRARRHRHVVRHDAALVGGFLVLALAFWFLTLKPSGWLWDHAPLLRYYQFPSRMFGAIGICLPIAASGALALALAALERRVPGSAGRVAGRSVLLCLGAVVAFNGGTERPLPMNAAADHRIDAHVVRRDERSFRDVGTTGNREFLPLSVQVAEYTSGIPRYRDAIERLYPEADWLGGLFLAVDGELSFGAWRALPLRATVEVENPGTVPATLAFRQLLFPGWRVWLDGRAVSPRAAPYVAAQQAAPGFMVVDVPSGVHRLTFAFGPTPLRAAATLASALALCAAAGMALAGLHPDARTPAARTRWLGIWVTCVACALVVCVRALGPAFHRVAAVPLPVPDVADGRWLGASPAWSSHQTSAQLIVPLARAVRQPGHASLHTPGGPRLGPDAHADVRFLTVPHEDDPGRAGAGGWRREWLYLHPPSGAGVLVTLPDVPGLLFHASLALDPAMWRAPTGDGVRFRATVAAVEADGRDSPPADVLDVTLDPRARTEDRRWLPVEADLSAYRGRTVRLTLATEHRGDPTYDWSGWANPVIVRRDTARRVTG